MKVAVEEEADLPPVRDTLKAALEREVEEQHRDAPPLFTELGGPALMPRLGARAARRSPFSDGPPARAGFSVGPPARAGFSDVSVRRTRLPGHS